jgi:hypothetical protein
MVADAPATPAVTTPIAATSGIDLQIVDVRLIDNGDASRQIGPCYRVTFRNAGSTTVDHEFNVALVAADGANLTSDLPLSETRVASLASGGLSHVDVRLPVTAFQMGADSHSEFGKLFVFVDSHREVNETNRDNNVAGFDRTTIQPAA